MRLVRKPRGINENITPMSNWNVAKKDVEEEPSMSSSLLWLDEIKETKIEERNVTHINQLQTTIQRKHLQRGREALGKRRLAVTYT